MRWGMDEWLKWSSYAVLDVLVRESVSPRGVGGSGCVGERACSGAQAQSRW